MGDGIRFERELLSMNNHFNGFQFAALLPEPSPVSALCWQMHRLLTVLVSLLRVWVHCPRASNGPLPRRSNLVGYVQWDAQFDRFLLVKQSLTSSFPGHSVRWDARSEQSYRSQPGGVLGDHLEDQVSNFSRHL